MSIESKIPTEEINIKDLSLESPESEGHFDLDKYLDQHAWDEMAAYLVKLQNELRDKPNSPPGTFFGLAANIHALNPKLDLGLIESDWRAADRRLLDFKSSSDWRRYLTLAVDMRMLDPSRDIHFTDTDKEKIERSFNTLSRAKEWWTIAYYTKSINFLTPNQKIKLDEEKWHGLLSYADELPGGGRHNKNSDWHELAGFGAELKQIDPTRNLKITESDWKHMEQWLQKRVELNDWTNFATTGLNMKILAAEKVTTDESGLHIQDKKPESKQRETPEVKKF